MERFDLDLEMIMIIKHQVALVSHLFGLVSQKINLILSKQKFQKNSNILLKIFPLSFEPMEHSNWNITEPINAIILIKQGLNYDSLLIKYFVTYNL